MHNGYEITCFGKKVGEVQSGVSGGEAPYAYLWSNGATTANLTDLPAGYLNLKVTDTNGLTGEAEITLNEPEPLKVEVVPYVYPNELNISCFECSNGFLNVSVTEGTAPYTYLWGDGSTTAYRYGLGAREYIVTVTDANSCVEKGSTTLAQPERSDWTMGGNANTNSAVQYVGTSDSQDLVLKSNGIEGIRLKSNGDIALNGSLTEVGLLYRDANGILRSGQPPEPPPQGPGEPCLGFSAFSPYWKVVGNDFTGLCENLYPLLGPLSNHPLRMITNASERMRVTETGLVGIGTNSPTDQLVIHTSLERSGITLVNDRADANAHTEIRFKKKTNTGVITEQWALGCDYEGDGGRDFFIWNEATTSRSLFIDEDDRVAIGEVNFGSDQLYRLGVEGGIVCRDVKVTAGNFPDYVFNKEYPLLSLTEVEKHITTKGHLPWFPTAAEVEADGGVEVGDMQLRLLRTAEEQMLYILQLEERISKAELDVQRIQELEWKIEQLLTHKNAAGNEQVNDH